MGNIISVDRCILSSCHFADFHKMASLRVPSIACYVRHKRGGHRGQESRNLDLFWPCRFFGSPLRHLLAGGQLENDHLLLAKGVILRTTSK